jgi:hypothetical protein
MVAIPFAMQLQSLEMFSHPSLDSLTAIKSYTINRERLIIN